VRVVVAFGAPLHTSETGAASARPDHAIEASLLQSEEAVGGHTSIMPPYHLAAGHGS